MRLVYTGTQQRGRRHRSRWLPACAALLSLVLSGPAAAQAPRQASSAVNGALSEADAEYHAARSVLYNERFAEGIVLAEKSVSAAEKVVALFKGRLPSKHTLAEPSPEELVARALDLLGHALIETGDLARAEQVFSRSHAIYERILAPDTGLFIAGSLAGLARLAALRGDTAAADRLWGEASGRFEPYEGVDASRCYSEIARLYLLKGDLARAESMLALVMDGSQGSNGDERVDFLRHLAELHLARGRTEDAEPLLQKALTDASFSANHAGVPSPRLARVLDSLGRLWLEAAGPDRAEKAFARALEIQEKALGPGHPAVAVSLDGLAQVHLRRGDAARAEPLLARALAIREKTLGAEHWDTSSVRLHTGDARRLSGDRRAAGELYERAHAALEKALGRDHPAVAEALLRRAELARAGGDPARSEALCQQALAVLENAFGAEHPRVADALDPLGETYARTGRIALAVSTLARSAEIRDRRAAALLAAGSEEQKAFAMTALRGQTDLLLSLPSAASPPDAGAVDLALTAVLRRKGRVLDALSMSRAALRDRRSPEDARLLRELVSIQGRIVDLIVRGPGAAPAAEHQAAVAELDRQKARLEAELGKRSATMIEDDRPLTLADVDAAIPRGAALVELVVHRPPGAGEARVAAYVRRGRSTSHVDLGEASAIDALVRDLREALSRPQGDPAAAARALDEKTMRKVRAHLDGTIRILISPDGDLNLIPFGALLDEDGRWLLERLSFTYLSSGRDLLRYLHDETPAEPGIAALVVGAPEFGAGDKKRSRYRAEVAATSFDIGDIRFPPLAGTAAEARAIGAEIAGATVLIGADATEEAVKKAAHPEIVHLATHGFFLPASVSAAGQTLDNPMLRAGIALATANHPFPGREDGVVTALDVSGLDLYGTKLVVLSACETGIGEARAGEGVYGLRRAVVMAGAQTLVMSLWKVSDRDTRDLMVDYHRRLRRGGGRSEALREATLALRDVPGNSHPFYWASFIASGDGSSLDGKDVAPRPYQPPPVSPGPRGCGCAHGEGGGSAASVAVALLLGGLLRRRRARANSRCQ